MREIELMRSGRYQEFKFREDLKERTVMERKVED